MNNYRKKMEEITPSAALNARVIAAAGAEAAKEGVHKRRSAHPGTILLAAALSLLLCIGVAASGIYYTRVVLPGRGVAVVADSRVLVLPQVLPFGERQIDYVILTKRDDARELRVIVTGGRSESGTDFQMQKLRGDKYGDFTVEQTSYFGSLTAETADGRQFTLHVLPEDHREGQSKFDVYTCVGFPDVDRLTLSAASGERVDVVLCEYDEPSAVLEKQANGFSLRVLPMAQGSRYVFFDYVQTVFGADWVLSHSPAVTLIGENGEEGHIANYVGSNNGSYTEMIGRLEEPMASRIVDFIIEPNCFLLNAHCVNAVSVENLYPLTMTVPAVGERTTLAQPQMLFCKSGISISASAVRNAGDQIVLEIHAGDVQAPETLSVSSFGGSGYLRTAEGQWYVLKSSSGVIDASTDAYVSVILQPVDEPSTLQMTEVFGTASGLLLEQVTLGYTWN